MSNGAVEEVTSTLEVRRLNPRAEICFSKNSREYGLETEISPRGPGEESVNLVYNSTYVVHD